MVPSGSLTGGSCTARLLIREIEDPSPTTADVVDEICKLFEGGQSLRVLWSARY